MTTPLRILHLEDDPLDAEIIHSALDWDGLAIDVTLVDSRGAFIQALERERFAIILSDYNLGGFDGMTALKLAKEKAADVPFILISGTLGDELAVETLKNGATDYVLKDRLFRLGPCVRRALKDVEEQRMRKQAEEALRKSVERNQFIMNSLSLSLFTADTSDFRTTWISDNAERVCGFPPDKFTADTQFWLSRIHPEDLEAVRSALVRNDKRSSLVHLEYRWLCADGQYRWVLNHGVFLSAENSGFLGTWMDITERKSVEQEHKQLEEQFRQAQKMEAIGTLAGGIAHDFNNLMTCVIGYGELILAKLPPDDANRSKLKAMVRAGHRATALTRQLLAFSRKQTLAPKILSLSAVVDETLKMLSRIVGEDVKVTSNLQPGVAHIRADPVQVEQVIMNLVVNARDAMPDGGVITLKTQNAELDEAFVSGHNGSRAGRFVQLSVTDTGTGMDAATKARIFEPFFTTKEVGRGTGLGLSTVYGIVKQSHGYIDVESTVGQGTTFSIYFPRVDQATESSAAAAALLPALRGRETILLAEDEENLREMVNEMLTSQGYRVLLTSNGHEALDVIKRNSEPIHLLLTDVVMPGMSGRILAQQATALLPKLKVLFQSGYASSALLKQGELDPTIHYLEKPFTPESLARKVRETLDSSSP